jgi:hypothetical protein
MIEPNEDGADPGPLINDNPIESFLTAVQDARGAKPQEPAAPPADPEPPAPEPPAPSWREAKYPNAPDAHGWYKDRTLGEVDDGIRKLEGATSEAQHRANLAEAKAVAAETANTMLQAKLQKFMDTLGPTQPPPLEEDLFAGVDLESEWVLQPAKVRKLLEQDILSKADKRNQALVAEQISALRKEITDSRAEDSMKSERQRLVSELQGKAEVAARTALEELKIPQTQWHSVLDLLVPALTSSTGPYAQKGGVTEKANYVEAATSNPIIRAGIASLFASGQAAPPVPPNPPGQKSVVPPPEPRKDLASQLSSEVRELALQTARMSGITDPVELEQFLEEAAQKIAANRRKGRKDRG